MSYASISINNASVLLKFFARIVDMFKWLWTALLKYNSTFWLECHMHCKEIIL